MLTQQWMKHFIRKGWTGFANGGKLKETEKKKYIPLLRVAQKGMFKTGKYLSITQKSKRERFWSEQPKWCQLKEKCMEQQRM